VVQKSQGSLHNIDLLKKNSIDLGIIASDSLDWIYKKAPEIAESIRVIFQLYTEEVHLLARNDIRSVEDLKRKSLYTGSEKSGNWFTISNILYKMFVPRVEKIYDLSPTDAVISVLTNQIDAMAFVAGKPVGLFKKLEKMTVNPKHRALLKNIHFIPIKDEELLRKYYVPSEIGPSDYAWVDRTVPTIGVKALLVRIMAKGDKKSPNQADRNKELSSLVETIIDNFDKLKQFGHPKWKEIDLNTQIVRPWRGDPVGGTGVGIKELKEILK